MNFQWHNNVGGGGVEIVFNLIWKKSEKVVLGEND